MSQTGEKERGTDGGELNMSQSHGQVVWRQFRKNRPALVSLWCIGLLAFVALTADLIAGNKPYYMEYKGKSYYPAFRQYAINLGVMDWPKELKRRRNFKKLKTDVIVFPPIPYGPGEIRHSRKIRPSRSRALAGNGSFRARRAVWPGARIPLCADNWTGFCWYIDVYRSPPGSACGLFRWVGRSRFIALF